MSEFVSCKTKIKDRAALVEALTEMGWTKEQIEVCDDAQHLYGYQGDRRSQKANVIIRKQHVGSASNDIGFVRKSDGTYEAIISAYDRGKHNEKWLKRLSQNYTEKLYTREAKRKGYEVRKVKEKGKVVLTFVR